MIGCIQKSVALGALALGLALMIGCSSSSSVWGKVNVDGQPLAKGTISFMPEKGEAATAGGPIANGQYRIKSVPAGKMRVVVMADMGTTSSDQGSMMKQMKEAGQKAFQGRRPSYAYGGGAARPASSSKTLQGMILPGTKGNGQVHDIKPGGQELNIELQTH